MIDIIYPTDKSYLNSTGHFQTHFIRVFLLIFVPLDKKHVLRERRLFQDVCVCVRVRARA